MSQLKFVGTNIDGLLGRAEQLKVRDRNLNDLIGLLYGCAFSYSPGRSSNGPAT